MNREQIYVALEKVFECKKEALVASKKEEIIRNYDEVFADTRETFYRSSKRMGFEPSSLIVSSISKGIANVRDSEIRKSQVKISAGITKEKKKCVKVLKRLTLSYDGFESEAEFDNIMEMIFNEGVAYRAINLFFDRCNGAPRYAAHIVLTKNESEALEKVSSDTKYSTYRYFGKLCGKYGISFYEDPFNTTPGTKNFLILIYVC